MIAHDVRVAGAVAFEYAVEYSRDNELAITQDELSKFGETEVISRDYAVKHVKILESRRSVKGHTRFGKHWLTWFLDKHDLSVKAHSGQKIIPFERLCVDIINWQVKLHLLMLSGRYAHHLFINGDEAAQNLFKAPKRSVAPKGMSHSVTSL